MKNLCTTIFALIIIPAFCGSIYSQPPSFYVDDVLVVTDANATMIHRYVNQTVSWNGISNQKELSCLRSRLKETGIFRSVTTNLRPTSHNRFNLVVTARLRSQDYAPELNKVTIQGYESQIDSAEFWKGVQESQILNKKIIIANDFPALQNAIVNAMRRSFRVPQADESWFPVVTFRRASSKTIELVVKNRIKCGGS